MEAKLENKDVGFVRVGRPTEIKVEAFPFTRYGLVHATLTSISKDAVTEPKVGQTDSSSMQLSVPDEDLHYLVHLRLDQNTLSVDGHLAKLTPGMAITAVIKTGRRHVIDFVLSPLAKATSEAGHER